MAETAGWDAKQAEKSKHGGTARNRGQVQPCRNLRMIEQVVVFATDDKREASQVSQYGSVPILAVEAKQRLFLRELIRREILADGGEALAQFPPSLLLRHDRTAEQIVEKERAEGFNRF